MKCAPVCNHKILKFKLSERTMKTISKSTKLSEEELKSLSLDEQIKLMEQRGSLKKQNPVKIFFAEKYRKLGEKLGLLNKEHNIYTDID